MSDRTERAELTVMVMVRKKGTDLIAVQERRKGDWDGLIFPGGHLERGESFLDAARREVMEETGLTLTGLECCGVGHWSHASRPERYFAVLYRAEGEGELLESTCEGRNFWMPLDEYIASRAKAPAMDEYLTCFLGRGCELFAEYDGAWTAPLVRKE